MAGSMIVRDVEYPIHWQPSWLWYIQSIIMILKVYNMNIFCIYYRIQFGFIFHSFYYFSFSFLPLIFHALRLFRAVRVYPYPRVYPYRRVRAGSGTNFTGTGRVRVRAGIPALLAKFCHFFRTLSRYFNRWIKHTTSRLTCQWLDLAY